LKNHGDVVLRLLAAWMVFMGLAFPVTATDSPNGVALAPGQFLKGWLILKPIPVTGPSNQAPNYAARKQALAQDWLQSTGGDAQFQPHAAMKITIAGHLLKWQPVKLDNGLADFLVNGHPMDNALAYRLIATQEVLDKHRFSHPWVAVRDENSSIWFVAERSESAQRFDRLYIQVTTEGPVTANITPYDFVLSGWATLGKLFVDFDPEARTIAAEIAEKLKHGKRAAR
jgi:hypothetical protein